MFKNLSVKFKLLLVVELFAVVFLIFGWYAFDTINLVKVGGKIFSKIGQGENLIADLSSPTLYVLESYFNAVQLSETNDPAEIQTLVDRGRALAERFEARRQHWEKQDLSPEMRSLIGGPIAEHARKFFDIFNQELVPAVQAQKEDRARDTLRGPLKTEFEAHRRSIAELLKLAEEVSKQNEQEAGAIIDRRRIVFFSLGIGAFLFALFSVAFPVSRAISKPLKEIESAAKKIAMGDLDCNVEYRSADELGSLVESFRNTIQYIQKAAGIADALSQGDLTVNVTPQSERDVLNRSLQTMTASLHSLIGKITQSSIQLMSTATEITATAKQQEMTVADYGASANEIAAAVKEISATAQQLTKTMDQVTEVAGNTANLADTGRTNVGALETAMRLLTEATGSISAQLSTISEKAHNINLVITTITKVADQTNLLSINAAIEAEKAGEYGVGFLVVAREIRRLADQTAVATLDIEETVKQMQSAVSSGVMEMDKFTQQVRQEVEEVHRVSSHFTQIFDSVHGVIEQFLTVNEGMRSQSLGAQQISQAMIQFSDGVRQTAASLKEFNMSTDHMRDAVKGLREELSRFCVGA